MKFKVGDRVKVREDLKPNEYYSGVRFDVDMQKMKGRIVTIQEAFPDNSYRIEEYGFLWTDEMFENKEEYTYEVLKKSPIGTKITLEKMQDKQLVKTALNRIENDDYRFFIRDFEGLNTGNYGKIIKIEEPTYQTVYEAKIEILNEVEKRYLRGVIRPYLDRIKSIEKFIFSTGRAKIVITVKDDDSYWYINLPPFEKDTMYKNMEEDKEYTLEELGL